MEMNKFYNGKEITEENLISMMQEAIENNWQNSDIEESTEKVMEKIATEGYEGKEEDIECILEKLQNTSAIETHKNANLQDVADIISHGEWYFKEDIK